MRMMVGLDAPTSGRVTIDGQHYRHLRFPLRHVGALLDAKAIHPGRSARDHLRWLADSNGISRRRVDEVLDLVGLADVADRRSGGFSLGMGQRLGIAAALLGDPGTLLLDEPVNGLDPEGIQWIRKLLRSLADEGRSILVSSHLMSEMAMTADHVIVIGRGRLVTDASMADVVAEHAHARVLVHADGRQAELADLVVEHGGTVDPTADGGLTVVGLEPVAIGRLAATSGIVLAELTPQGASLEEAFLEITQHETDHRSGLVGATQGA